MSAGSFSHRGALTITEEDVVMQQRDETKRTEMRKKKHNNNKRSLVRFLSLKQKHTQGWCSDAESNNAPRWPCRETHPVAAADLCLI